MSSVPSALALPSSLPETFEPLLSPVSFPCRCWAVNWLWAVLAFVFAHCIPLFSPGHFWSVSRPGVGASSWHLFRSFLYLRRFCAWYCDLAFAWAGGHCCRIGGLGDLVLAFFGLLFGRCLASGVRCVILFCSVFFASAGSSCLPPILSPCAPFALFNACFVVRRPPRAAALLFFSCSRRISLGSDSSLVAILARFVLLCALGLASCRALFSLWACPWFLLCLRSLAGWPPLLY